MNLEFGIYFFVAAFAFFVIFIISGFITIFFQTDGKARKTWKKITLISLLLVGVSLLLTSILCGWYG